MSMNTVIAYTTPTVYKIQHNNYLLVTVDTEREWFAAFFEYLKFAVSLTTFDVTAYAISYIRLPSLFGARKPPSYWSASVWITIFARVVTCVTYVTYKSTAEHHLFEAG